MQREIKFRAWDKEKKIILPVTLMEFNQWWVSCMQISESNGNPLDYGDRNSFKNEETDRHILMQYTGLKDKNGKEIYEGDIVEYKDFSNGMYLFKEQPKARGVIKINNLLSGIYLKGMGTFEESKVEVIGNIYEKPELLEVSE